MKFEALNGNILPIGKMPQEQRSKDADEAIDDDELPEVVDEEEPSDAKKKKQTRKKRSLNWEEAERGLLLEVIKPKVDYVENRNVDSKSIKAKRLAWMHITKQFNALNFRHRSLEQIQVQWRSMKNTAKREYQNKHPKSSVLDGIELLDFMEEMQKEPISTRSQTRAPTVAIVIKKEEQDIDEDLPLSALPTTSDESLLPTQTSSVTLPSPPPSAESINESQHVTIRSINNKKTIQKTQQNRVQDVNKPKRQRSQNSIQSLDMSPPPSITPNAGTSTLLTANSITDDAYRKDLFDIIKRSRLAEMDYARREHEQKMRHQQMEQEMKLDFYRKKEELKMQQMREDHEIRIHHSKLEHEARMRAYTARIGGRNFKSDILNNSTSANMDVISN